MVYILILEFSWELHISRLKQAILTHAQSNHYTAQGFVAPSFHIGSMLAIHHVRVIDAQVRFVDLVEAVPAHGSVQGQGQSVFGSLVI